MKNKYGTISMYVLILALVVGIFAMTTFSIIYGGLYSLIIFLGGYMVLMRYCRKCPHSMNDSCHHKIPGLLAKKLPYKKTGKYTFYEYISTIGSIVIVFALPFVSMVDRYYLLVSYLILWVIAILMVKTKVCKFCYNRWCLSCPNKVKM
ncbi:MAG: hypothetical protein CVU95_00020 [Firmicutes bacterium HGW-Firmicutes-2]|jgi:hypothetical protein|nr:MAG: hypothetical protein CVU95_00020 [Firmicutes bacterium HGW-Firmicutes-2]